MNRVLVLDFDANTQIATCFDRASKGLINIRVDLGTEPRPGQFIQYNQNCPIENGLVVVSYQNAQIEDAQPEDCVKIKDGQLKISAWIGFSDKPHHKTYDRNLAFAGWYGLIDSSAVRENAIQLGEKRGKRLFTSFIVVNDLNYVNNSSQLFKVDTLKFAISGRENEVNDELRNLDIFEETLAAMDGRASRAGENRLTPAPRLHSSASTPILHPAQPVQVQQLSREIETAPILPPTPSTPQSPDLLCRLGIAMTVALNGDLIIWMCDLKAVAVLKRTCPNAHSVRLGSLYLCFVQKQGSYYYVTDVRGMVEGRMPFKVHEYRDGSFEAEFVVDVCTPNFKFNFWTIYTRIAVLNSEHFGMVTTADKIMTPTGKVKKFYQMMRTYMGDPRSARMIGRCRLTEQRLPRMVVDENYDGSEIVVQYHWKLYGFVGSPENVARMETDLRMENLRLDAVNYQEEDDVARQKWERQQQYQHRY